MGSKVKNVLKKASNFVLPNLGAAGSFANGLIQGKGLKGSLNAGLKTGIRDAGIAAAIFTGGAGLGGAGAGAGGGAGGGAGTFGNILSGAKSFLPVASSLYSGVQSTKAQDKLKEQLLASQAKSEAAFSPYNVAGTGATNSLGSRLAAGFQPGDLTKDPGYQFNLDQGTKAIDRSAAARGSLFSGATAKELQQFGQGLADNTYNKAYERWASENNQLQNLSGQGLNAAQSLSGVYDNQGNIRANNTLEKSNILNRTLSDLTGAGVRYSRDANGNIVDQYGRVVGRA